MWTFTIPGQPPLSPADLNSGELGLIYSLVVEAVPHTEDDISPNHCPICRNAIAVAATMRTLPKDDYTLALIAASQVVGETPAYELKTMIGDTLADEKLAGPNRAERRAKPAPVKRPAKKARAKKRAR